MNNIECDVTEKLSTKSSGVKTLLWQKTYCQVLDTLDTPSISVK